MTLLYPNVTVTVPIGSRQDLQTFNGLNIQNYFLGYYYYYKNNQPVEIEEAFYQVNNSDDVTIYAKWNEQEMIKYYYTDGLSFQISGESSAVCFFV